MAARPGSRRKGSLDRDRILRAALAVVDANGPANGAEGLTMRRVATELGVDPMAIYRYVPSKDDLLDGMVELLWREVPPPERGDNWVEPLRSFAHALRATINAHPGAAPLLLIRRVLVRPAMEAFDTLLNNLRDAGFDDFDAGQIVRTVCATALGDALTGLTYRALTQRPASGEPATQTDTRTESDADAWITLSQALPPGTPAPLVRTAYAVCVCEPDADFTFVLDLILQGAEDLKRDR